MIDKTTLIIQSPHGSHIMHAHCHVRLYQRLESTFLEEDKSLGLVLLDKLTEILTRLEAIRTSHGQPTSGFFKASIVFKQHV